MIQTHHILLIEDSAADARLIEEYLHGDDIVHVTTLRDALATLAQKSYDAIILDLHLPDGIGMSLVRKVRDHAPHQPIIVLTGSLSQEHHGLGTIAIGAQEFLNKNGLTPERLRTSVAYAIERAKVERALSESEERFAQFADNTDSVMWLFKADGTQMIWVNPAYERVWGRSRDRAIANPREMINGIHPDDRERVRTAWEGLASGEAPYDERYRIVRPDNIVRWIHDRGFTVRDAQGAIYRVGGVARDITELREAEAAAQRSSQRLTNILDTAGEGIYGLDERGCIQFANPAAARILGYPAEMLIGKDSHSLFHGKKEDGTPNPVEDCPIYNVLHDGTSRRVERDTFWTREGKPIAVHYVMTPRIENGVVVGGVVVFTDITERLRAEETARGAQARFRVTFDHSAQLIMLTDAQGRILEVNQTLLLTIGQPLEKLQGMYAWEVPRLGGTEEDRLRFEGALATLLHDTDIRLEYQRDLDGHAMWLDVVARPIKDAAGKVTEVLWEARDITELRAAQLQLEAANEKLRDGQRFRVQLLNNIAHDMSTPLMVLQLRLDSIDETSPDSDTYELEAKTLDVLRAQAHQLATLTRDLRDVSLMEAGTLRLRLKDIDLASLAKVAADSIRQIADPNSVRIDFEAHGATPIRGDETRLQQVATNLLSNAVKFSPAGGVVTVRVTRRDGEAHLEVEDNGPGIPTEALPRLFRPFSQVHKDTDVKKGTGLGLYIVKGIAEAHGGRIEVLQSAPGKGARFRFAIPAAPR